MKTKVMVRRHSAVTAWTCSKVRFGELKPMPRQPLICTSKNAGATQASGLRADGATAVTRPASAVRASGRPVA